MPRGDLLLGERSLFVGLEVTGAAHEPRVSASHRGETEAGPYLTTCRPSGGVPNPVLTPESDVTGVGHHTPPHPRKTHRVDGGGISVAWASHLE